MSIKKDMGLPPPPAIPWRLAVIAPPGFDHPDLAAALARRLDPLLRRRASAGRLDLLTPTGGPVGAAVGPWARSRGWFSTGLGSAAEFGAGWRTAVALLAHADAAVLVFVGDRPPAELQRLAGVAA